MTTARHLAQAAFVTVLGAFTHAATLTDWRLDGSSLRFQLQCESNLTYAIQRSSNLGNWRTVARSNSDSVACAFEFPVESSATPFFFRALQTNAPLLGGALMVRHGIDPGGKVLHVDSFDSSVPGRNANGRWHIAVRRDRGVLSMNDGLTNHPAGNVRIYGRVHTGTTLEIGPNDTIGSIAWHAGMGSGVQPGWASNDADGFFPGIVLPNLAWQAMPPGGIVDGVSYAYVFSASGDYRMPSGTLSGRILVAATNVRVRVDGEVQLTGSDQIRIQPDASIVLYLNGTNAQITGAGIVNEGTPRQCRLLGSPRLQQLSLGGNGENVCVVYAPSSHVLLLTGATTDEDFSGAVVARSVRFTGNYYVHFDEELLRYDPRQ